MLRNREEEEVQAKDVSRSVSLDHNLSRAKSQRHQRNGSVVLGRKLLERSFSERFERSDKETKPHPSSRNTMPTPTSTGFRHALDRMMPMNRGAQPQNGTVSKTQSTGDLKAPPATFNDDDNSFISRQEQNESPENKASAPSPNYPEHIKQLGVSAFKAMIEADKIGDICIVEKSYVLIGTPLKDQSLFFCGLQNLVNMEREVSNVMLQAMYFYCWKHTLKHFTPVHLEERFDERKWSI